MMYDKLYKAFMDNDKINEKFTSLTMEAKELFYQSYRISRQIEEKNREIDEISLIYFRKKNKLKHEIIQLQNEKESIDSKINTISAQIDEIETVKRNNPLGKVFGAFRIENGELHVSDNEISQDFPYTIRMNNSGESNDVEFLFHCTSFLPNNRRILSNYDGGKIVHYKTAYRGLQIDVPFRHTRRTVHFSKNSIATNTGTGEGAEWNKMPYIIMDSFEKSGYQIYNKDNASDCWSSESFNLSDDAIILVNGNFKDTISMEDINSTGLKHIFIDGDKQKSVANLICALGGSPYHRDTNNPSHANSKFKAAEETAEFLNVMLKLFGIENKYDENTKTVRISKTDLLKIIDFRMCTGWGFPSTYNVFNDENIKRIDNMFYAFGIKEESGEFILDADYYHFLSKAEKHEKYNPNETYFENLGKIYKEYILFSQELDSKTPSEVASLVDGRYIVGGLENKIEHDLGVERTSR